MNVDAEIGVAAAMLMPLVDSCRWNTPGGITPRRDSMKVLSIVHAIFAGVLRCEDTSVSCDEIVEMRYAAPFDLVVAGGVFDYLPQRRRALIERFGDWFLIERSEEDVLCDCEEAGIPPENVRIDRDETRLALLIEITKR
jgi:hypothetical protein